jgi:hypothetical protein
MGSVFFPKTLRGAREGGGFLAGLSPYPPDNSHAAHPSDGYNGRERGYCHFMWDGARSFS